MKDGNSCPPWEFLDSASSFALHSYELSRLGHAANLHKEIVRLMDQWLEENACALLARWLLERRKRPSGALEPSRSPKPDDASGSSASHNALAKPPVAAAGRGTSTRFV